MKIKSFISYLLIFSLLLQSCTVYQKTTGTFEEAIAAETNKIKAIKNDGSKQFIKNFQKSDSLYYGTVKIDGKKTKIALHKKDFDKIYLQDKDASVILTSGLIAAIVIGCIAIGLSSPNSAISNSLSP